MPPNINASVNKVVVAAPLFVLLTASLEGTHCYNKDERHLAIWLSH